MILYIDALFKKRECWRTPDSTSESGGLFTSDSAGMRDMPPYTIVPSIIMTSDTQGDSSVFADPDVQKNLNAFGNHIMTLKEYPVFVGWNMDQVVIPCITANAVIYNAKMPSWIMRSLNDKWSKTVGHSVERAFVQGWYQSSKSDFPDGRTTLTLGQACSLSGVQDPDFAAENCFGTDIPADIRTLMARISTVSTLFARYRDISAGNRK